jgi:hypothetical protein
MRFQLFRWNKTTSWGFIPRRLLVARLIRWRLFLSRRQNKPEELLIPGGNELEFNIALGILAQALRIDIEVAPLLHVGGSDDIQFKDEVAMRSFLNNRIDGH